MAWLNVNLGQKKVYLNKNIKTKKQNNNTHVQNSNSEKSNTTNANSNNNVSSTSKLNYTETNLADNILSVTFLLVTLNEWRRITPPRRVIFLHNHNVCRVSESNGAMKRFLWISSCPR